MAQGVHLQQGQAGVGVVGFLTDLKERGASAGWQRGGRLAGNPHPPRGGGLGPSSLPGGGAA